MITLDKQVRWDILHGSFAVRRTEPYYVFRIYIPSILLMVFDTRFFYKNVIEHP